MLAITWMFYILCFALTVGIVVSIIIVVPLTIYVIPYALWHGVQLTKGKYKDQKEAGFFKTVKYATKLYSSWIFKKDLTF